jgi:transcriptional regulator with XRE-family HTH domain
MERRGTARESITARQARVAVMVPSASFGALLRAHRERALLSQEQLAERAGLSARTIRELEAGRVRRPRGTSVQLLAQALRLQGGLRQAFAAAARSHPSTQAGEAVPRDRAEGVGLGDPTVLVLSFCRPTSGGPGVVVVAVTGHHACGTALSRPQGADKAGRRTLRNDWAARAATTMAPPARVRAPGA